MQAAKLDNRSCESLCRQRQKGWSQQASVKLKSQVRGRELWAASQMLLSWPRHRPWHVKILACEMANVYKIVFLKPN